MMGPRISMPAGMLCGIDMECDGVLLNVAYQAALPLSTP